LFGEGFLANKKIRIRKLANIFSLVLNIPRTDAIKFSRFLGEEREESN
jgi:hypothetical protein